jgi:hypothetical protein
LNERFDANLQVSHPLERHVFDLREVKVRDARP